MILADFLKAYFRVLSRAWTEGKMEQKPEPVRRLLPGSWLEMTPCLTTVGAGVLEIDSRQNLKVEFATLVMGWRKGMREWRRQGRLSFLFEQLGCEWCFWDEEESGSSNLQQKTDKFSFG